MAGRRGYRSRQAMQKIVKDMRNTWGAGTTLIFLKLAEFDEEVIVKRIRASIQLTADSTPNLGDMVPWKWAIIQTDTTQVPTHSDFIADTRIIATGILNVQSVSAYPWPDPLLYDNTITMRKLKETAVWLIVSKCDETTVLEELKTCAYTQLHYLED